MMDARAEALDQLRATIQLASDLLDDISALVDRMEEIRSWRESRTNWAA